MAGLRATVLMHTRPMDEPDHVREYVEPLSDAGRKQTAFFNACYSSRMAPWRTVICVTGSPELFNSLRI